MSGSGDTSQDCMVAVGFADCFDRERRLWLRNACAKCHFLRLRTLTEEEQVWCAQEVSGAHCNGQDANGEASCAYRTSFLGGLGIIGSGSLKSQEWVRFPGRVFIRWPRTWM